jgi:hypothetical protein
MAPRPNPPVRPVRRQPPPERPGRAWSRPWRKRSARSTTCGASVAAGSAAVRPLRPGLRLAPWPARLWVWVRPPPRVPRFHAPRRHRRERRWLRPRRRHPCRDGGGAFVPPSLCPPGAHPSKPHPGSRPRRRPPWRLRPRRALPSRRPARPRLRLPLVTCPQTATGDERAWALRARPESRQQIHPLRTRQSSLWRLSDRQRHSPPLARVASCAAERPLALASAQRHSPPRSRRRLGRGRGRRGPPRPPAPEPGRSRSIRRLTRSAFPGGADRDLRGVGAGGQARARRRRPTGSTQTTAVRAPSVRRSAPDPRSTACRRAGRRAWVKKQWARWSTGVLSSEAPWRPVASGSCIGEVTQIGDRPSREAPPSRLRTAERVPVARRAPLLPRAGGVTWV